MANRTTAEGLLLKKAKALVKRSYSPYSSFRVAAVIETGNGRLFSGVNVENSSYRLTMCAEQTAIGNMVTSGACNTGREKKRPGIKRIMVYTPDSNTITPCGACLQLIAEHSDDPLLLLVGATDKIRKIRLKELIPHAFSMERG